MEEPIRDLAAAAAGLEDSASPPPALLESTRRAVRAMLAEPLRARELSAELGALPPHGAAWLAVSLGAAVENGLDPSVAGPDVARCFRGFLEALALGRATRAHEAALLSLGQGTVTHLARLPELRASLEGDEPLMRLLEECEPHSPAVTWVRSLLRRRSGDLFVVHGPTGRVMALRFSSVENCFHLFSLIQSVLGAALPGGRPPDGRVAAAARGGDAEGVSDEAWWHYQISGPKPEVGRSAWGEAHVDTLRRPDGTYAVTLWTTVLHSRTWNSGFFSPALEAAPSDMVFLEELTGASAEGLRDELLGA